MTNNTRKGKFRPRYKLDREKVGIKILGAVVTGLDCPQEIKETGAWVNHMKPWLTKGAFSANYKKTVSNLPNSHPYKDWNRWERVYRAWNSWETWQRELQEERESVKLDNRLSRLFPKKKVLRRSTLVKRAVRNSTPRRSNTARRSAAPSRRSESTSSDSGGTDDPDGESSDFPLRQRLEIEYLRSLTGHKGGILEKTYRLSLLAGGVAR